MTVREKLYPRDDDGFETARPLYNLSPKALVVIGQLEQFVEGDRMQTDKIRSFELFRRGLVHPEVLTCDELFERARAIVEADAALDRAAERSDEAAEPDDSDIPW